MKHNNKWYVVTGGPSTGKTTLLVELDKMGYKAFPEAARLLIDEAVAKGISITDELRADEKHFQEDVARLKQKIENGHNPITITFFARGMHDTLAYMRFYNYRIEHWVDELLEHSTYRKVFILDPFPIYQPDYARTEGPDFPKHLQKLLKEAYTEYGMKPVNVPVASSIDRAQFVLQHIREDKAG